MALKNAKEKADSKTRAVARRSRAVARADSEPRYLVLEWSFIDNQQCPPGTEIVYWGVPGKTLKPLNALAKANKIAGNEVRRATYEGDTAEERAQTKADELRNLDNDLQGITPADELDESEDPDALTDAEKAELERHARTTAEQTAAAQEDDSNYTKVKLTGDPSGKEPEHGKQGATPVLDGKAK